MNMKTSNDFTAWEKNFTVGGQFLLRFQFLFSGKLNMFYVFIFYGKL